MRRGLFFIAQTGPWLVAEIKAEASLVHRHVIVPAGANADSNIVREVEEDAS
ncbi:MAG TPA: hypothetical protein VIS04_00540 [Woeseiaceae bacterium]